MSTELTEVEIALCAGGPGGPASPEVSLPPLEYITTGAPAPGPVGFVKRLLITMPNTNNLWYLDRDIPEIKVFSPPLTSPQTGYAGQAVIGFPTGQIICNARKTSPTTYYHYHWDPDVDPLSWNEHTTSGGTVQKYHSPGAPNNSSYDDVWSVTSADYIQHFDGTLWTTDAIPSSSLMNHIFSLGGLDEVWVSAAYQPWFRTGGAIGSGVWVNRAAQYSSDTGLPLSGPDQLVGVWAVSKNEVYWFAQGHPAGDWIFVVKWNGSNFSVISSVRAGTRSAGFSESSFDALALNHMWAMQADPSWGRFYFIFFNGTQIGRQAPGEFPDGPEHNMLTGCELILDPTDGSGYAAGGYGSPSRIAVWEKPNPGIDLWSLLTTKTVPLHSSQVGVGFQTQFVEPPNQEMEIELGSVEVEQELDPLEDVEQSVSICLEIVDEGCNP